VDAPLNLEALMERYVDGDSKAFDALYRALRPPLLACLRRWLRDEARTEDAFQATLMKLHRSRDRYIRGAPVLPWCVTIARNVALDALRLRAAKDQALAQEDAERIANPEPAAWSEADDAEVVAAVREAIEALPPLTREVVKLHKLEGRHMAEIAELLGIKPGAARVRAHRGYKELARRLVGLRSRARG
jgi:RNA polymerase sigma-70 factor (ECF subfamily)